MSILTLRLPADSRLPVVHGQWRRVDSGEILATYSEEQLAVALRIVEEVTECPEQMELSLT